MLNSPRRIPLYRHALVDTTNPDDFRDVFVNVFGARDFELRRAGGKFQAKLSCVWLKHIDLGFMSVTGACSYTVTPDIVRQQFGVRGSARTCLGDKEFPIDRDKTCVVPVGTSAQHNYSPDYAEFRLRIEQAALRVKLGALIGRPVTTAIRFEPPSASENQNLLRLRRLIAHLVQELDSEDGALPELAAAQYEQSLMVCFLYANRHNYSHLLESEAPASPNQVRRAEEFIEAHASLPLTVEALADIIGVGARHVASGFRQSRGISPRTFLMQIRLKHARRLLQMPDEAVSVAAVASRFGFGNAGFFAREYGKAFGESPSATLAGARRQ